MSEQAPKRRWFWFLVTGALIGAAIGWLAIDEYLARHAADREWAEPGLMEQRILWMTAGSAIAGAFAGFLIESVVRRLNLRKPHAKRSR
ncbi:MAG: hypothetical protein AB7O59_06715 [Pirellulales bacterium]